MNNDIMSTMTLKEAAVTVGIYVSLETLPFKGSTIPNLQIKQSL